MKLLFDNAFSQVSSLGDTQQLNQVFTFYQKPSVCMSWEKLAFGEQNSYGQTTLQLYILFSSSIL